MSFQFLISMALEKGANFSHETRFHQLRLTADSGHVTHFEFCAVSAIQNPDPDMVPPFCTSLFHAAGCEYHVSWGWGKWNIVFRGYTRPVCSFLYAIFFIVLWHLSTILFPDATILEVSETPVSKACIVVS